MDGIMNGSRVGIRCYPAADERFLAEVQAVVDAWADGELTAKSLERQISFTYPAIRVIPQEPLAALGTRPVLYVYRDGHP